MNFVKLFSESDIQLLERSSSLQDLQAVLEKKGVNTDTVSSLLLDLYQFMTIQDFSLEQKHKIINLTIQLLKKLPECDTK